MIEQLARTSAEELRTGTTGDVEAGLADLHVRQARHRRRTSVTAAAAVVVALGVGWSAGSVLTRHGANEAPPTDRGPSPSSPTVGAGDEVCQAPLVGCVGDRTYRFDLDRPILWVVPPGFVVNGATPQEVQIDRHGGSTAGVTVEEHVRAARRDGSGPAPGVADDPHAFIDWVAGRPFLDASRISRTTIDGHPAWRVRVVLDPDSGPGASTCSGSPCHAITAQPGLGPTGIWEDMASEYTAFHLPGAGTTVVWTWSFSGNTEHLDRLQKARDGVTVLPAD